MNLVLRFQIRSRCHLDRFDRIRGSCLYQRDTLKLQYRIAKPPNAKRIEKKIRKVENVLKRYYKNLSFKNYKDI
jgi:hypothetical protein